jgi:hypothetical protein
MGQKHRYPFLTFEIPYFKSSFSLMIFDHFVENSTFLLNHFRRFTIEKSHKRIVYNFFLFIQYESYYKLHINNNVILLPNSLRAL